MNGRMPEWIHNTHAGYVLAAYAVAAVALIGLLAWSLCEHRAAAKEWRKLNNES